MKKKILILSISLIFIILISVISIYIVKNEGQKRIDNLIIEIKSHYNTYVKTNKETKLYKHENNKYIEFGKVNKDINLTLVDTDIDENTEYFKIDGMDLYIKYSDVEKIESYSVSDRYKNYIYFNNNIITNDITKFYDEDGNYLYTINNSFDFSILIKDNDRYGVVYNEELVYINKDDVKDIYENKNTDLKNKGKIRTLTYHFIYNPETYWCNQSICQSFEQFESHLKYIKENGYFSLKMNELEMYLDGKINIPEKSIVLTIDDATIFDVGAIDLLEEYEVNATIFVITGLKDNFEYLRSEYLDLESHTENMHNQYECSGYGSQGGGILCLPEETVLSDLKKSQDKLKGSKYFAYPFFDFSDRAISLLKKAGFNMAFIGQYTTDGYAYPKQTDKYKIPRKTIFSFTTMDEFISYLR